MKFVIYITLGLITLTSCAQKNTVVIPLTELPPKLQEVSGMHYATDNTFWVIEDSGNKNELYQLDTAGNLLHTLVITNAKNKDWEDLTYDNEGNLYIGDFGNNKNQRKDLRIIKVNQQDLTKKETKAAGIISFDYPEQKDFPPQKTSLFYDAESFILFEGYFYIFTKNRSAGFDGSSLVYKIPNQIGHHKAEKIGTFVSCNIYKHCALTSASISPDKKIIALLSHSKIWLIENFNSNNILEGTITSYNLNHVSQKESITFKNNNTVFLADEVKKKNGGYIYEVDLTNLKSKP